MSKHTELRPFQLEGVRQIYNFGGRALLCDEMGLGKTIQTLYWMVKTPKRRPVVVVAPASMKFTWQAEALLHFGLRTAVIEGRCYKGDKLPDCDIIILNYEILPSWLKLLRKLKIQMLVLDEVHYIKNLKAKRTRAAIKLSKGVGSVIGISGTPLTNRPIELWPVLRAVYPQLFPDREVFAWKYCKPRWTPWGWKYDGSSNSKKLHRVLKANVMIRRLKKDVLPELPDKIRRMIAFKLRDYSEYEEASDDFLAWLKKRSPARAERAKKSPALTRVGYLLRLVAKLKLSWTKQWIEEFFESHPDKKLVCLTMHTFVIEALKKHFPDALVIDGSVTGRKRHETVHSFQSSKRFPLLLGNWKAAGLGITLTAAHNAAALDFPWTPGDLLQGEDRVHRIGQKKDVIIHYLVALDTIEEKLMKILRKKSKVLDAILNGEGDEEDLNIFDELLAQLKETI